MEMITNSFPEYRVMIGRVVSIVVAPPTEIGASFPKYFTNKGAHSKAIISRMILESNAIVPNSGPFIFGDKYAGERIITKSGSNCHTV